MTENHNHIEECINEIDDLLFLLTKEDKWESLAKKLNGLLQESWNSEQKDAIKESIKFLNSAESITEEDVNILMGDLNDKLGTRMAEVFRKDITKFQLESYTKGHTEVGIKFEFNTVDKKALDWLYKKDVSQFWIGESHTRDLNERLNLLGAEALKQGMTKEEAARYFRDNFKDMVADKSLSYWKQLSNHVITRARMFGKVSAFEKAEVEYVKIENPNPETDICKFMLGKIIPVGKLIAQRDKLLKATTVEQIKKISPWYNAKQSKEIVESGEVPESAGLPPYHGGDCKSYPVIAYQEEIEAANIKKRFIDRLKKIYG
jgi:hypothetical protein